VRCKLRCMTVEHHIYYNHDKTLPYYTAVLRPVTKVGDPENEHFWRATPSGVARFHQDEIGQFEPGAYYYVDIAPGDVEGWDQWQLTEATPHASSPGASVKLNPRGDVTGDIELSIDNAPVALFFVEQAMAAYRARVDAEMKARDLGKHFWELPAPVKPLFSVKVTKVE